ncbi:hypothetical protein Tco_0241040 [Tanacetum coccineum]
MLFYECNTIVKQHDALSVPDTEETFDLAEKSRLKMLAKQDDPSLKGKKVNFTPVNYVALNKLSEHFVKHFVPQKQLSAEHAFWLPISQPVSKKPPVPSEPVLKKEIPCELSPIKFKDMKAVFNQMETKVAKFSVDKKYFEIEKKELRLDNDRLLEHIIYLVHTVVNSLAAINDYKNMQKSFLDEYNETLVLKAELAKKNDMIEEEFFIINELQAQLQAKNVSIEKLKEHIANIKGKNVVESVQNVHNSKLLLHQSTGLGKLGVSSSTEASGSKPMSNTKKDRITQTSSSNKKINKVEDQPRIAKSSLNNMNRVSKTVCNANVKHFVLNATSELICATCHECMFDAIHDLCVSDYLNDDSGVGRRRNGSETGSALAKQRGEGVGGSRGRGGDIVGICLGYVLMLWVIYGPELDAHSAGELIHRLVSCSRAQALNTEIEGAE